jgi:maltose alpha-D-glucosyltransferase/alpha-amylase
MENDRRQVELLHAMLFSLPGSPVLYYGDEIGIGDNIYLGDRNGVRTPMQWTGDRNAGFSRADPAQLHQPVILDPVFHYQAVNVEAQLRLPTSLLQWMRRLIRIRKRYAAFGRGALRFLACENRKVVAYLREFLDQTLLIVNNLSAVAQPAAIDLRTHRGLVPVELFGNHAFPKIEDQPYFLSLSPHSFYWFRLENPNQTA